MARFNLGAAPDASTCGGGLGSWDLMYRWPDAPHTSFATARIDGYDWMYGSSGYQVQYPVTAGLANNSAWLMGDLLVRQRLEIIPNDVTGERDVARITYTMENRGAIAHSVGLRSMIDTELNYNDGAIFRADGVGTIDHEWEFWGSDVPAKLQTLYSASDTVHVGTVTLRAPGSPAPDRVVIAQWPLIADTSFDYSSDGDRWITGDSALATYWNPRWLAAGATATYSIAYGRGTAGASTVAVNPSVGPWYGRNEVTLSVPGLAAGTTPWVTFGTKHAANMDHGAGWVKVAVPALITPDKDAKDVAVSVRAGSATGAILMNRDKGYTYRGVAVIFIRGIHSHLDPSSFPVDDAFGNADPNGIYTALLGRGVPGDALYQFSYRSGSPDRYGCIDTYADPAVDAGILYRQVNKILVDHRDVDVYLVGHSKGGVVAMSYLAMLASSHRDPAHLSAATAAGTGMGRLAGIVTLDSPIGGIAASVLWLNDMADLRCWDLGSLDGAKVAFMGQMNRLQSSAHSQNSLGSHASLGGLLYPGALAANNQALAEAASVPADPAGPDIITIGNVYDDTFNLGTLDAWLPYTTQWLRSSSGSAHTWARAIYDRSDGLFGIDVKWANHGRVTENVYAIDSIDGLINGRKPSTGTGFTEPPLNSPFGSARVARPASTEAAAMATIVASEGIGGAVTEAGGAPIAGAGVAAISVTSGKTWATTTAADGSYAIATGPGTYVVAVHDPSGSRPFGYAGDPGFTTQLADAMRTTVAGSSVTVNIQVPAGSAVGGTATFGGDSRAGVMVKAIDADGHVVATTETLADSTYSMVVPDGSFVVRVQGDRASFASGYYGQSGVAPDAASATAIAVTGSPVAGIDIDLAPIARLGGFVTDEYGGPLEGVFVTASTGDGAGVFSTVTGTDGSFVLPVDPGSYQVSFIDPTATHVDGWFGPSAWVADAGDAQVVDAGFDDMNGVSVAMPFPGMPGQPTDVVALPAHGGAWVDWTAPASTGGAAVQSYAVVASPNYHTCTAYAVPGCEVDGLVPGIAYTFRVWATNAAGEGAGSAPSDPLVATGVPGIPTNPFAVAGESSATVYWTRPADDGGSTITSYTVTGAPDGRTCTAPAGTTSCKVAGLSWWSYYTFTVTASNAIGEGQPSDASNGIGPVDLTKPTVVAPTVSIRANARLSGAYIPVAVNLAGSDSANGSGVWYFEIERSTDAGKTWSAPVTAWTNRYDTTIRSAGTTRFRARAVDWAANTSGWKAGVTLTPRLIQDRATAGRWSGKWSKASSTSYSGGTERYSKSSGASVRYTFTGRSVALVATIGPGLGKARIYIGSKLVATVDLLAPQRQYRTVVWQRTWSSRATRTVRVVVAGTSGRPRVDVDAFAVLK